MAEKRSWFRRRWLRALLLVAALLVALVAGAQWWLGSAVGRGMVESRLSAALGRPVRLGGAFRLSLLPLPGASGSELVIMTRDGSAPVLEAQEYLARLALRPLFDGEIEVVALEVQGAGIDLAQLAAEPSPPAQTGADFFQLPDIHDFELADARLYLEQLGQPPFLQIETLSLEQFELGVAAPFEGVLAYVAEDPVTPGGATAQVTASGEVTLLPRGYVDLGIASMDVGLEGWLIRDLQGQANMDLLTSLVEAELLWTGEGQRLAMVARADLNPPFPADQPGYRLEALELSLGEQTLSGQGCLLEADPQALHLALAAPSLDIDALEQVIGAWRDTTGPGSTAPDSAGSGPGQPIDLPFAINLQLEAESARYQGGLAEGVRLFVGGEPACPR